MIKILLAATLAATITVLLQAEDKNIYITNEDNVTMNASDALGFGGCNKSVGKSNAPTVILYSGIHVNNYDLEQDGLGSGTVGFDGMRGGTLDVYFKIGNGLAIGNSTYIALRTEFNEGNSYYSGYIPSGGSFVSVNEQVGLKNGDVELVLRDMDWSFGVNTYLDYMLEYNRLERSFESGYFESYTFYLLGVGFGVDGDVTDVFNIGIGAKGKISPFGEIHSKGASHDVDLSTSFSWMVQAEVPFSFHLGKHVDFRILPSVEYWRFSSSNNSAGLYVPSGVLIEWKLEAGLQLAF